MFVPENESLRKYRVPSSISKKIIEIVLDWPVDFSSTYSYSPIALLFFWEDSDQGNEYWDKLSRIAVKEKEKFFLPEEAKAYLRWLLRGEIKDVD